MARQPRSVKGVERSGDYISPLLARADAVEAYESDRTRYRPESLGPQVLKVAQSQVSYMQPRLVHAELGIDLADAM